MPLQDLKVVDLSRIVAGPYGTQVLGDLGAQVIKIEHPEFRDDTRIWGPPYINNDGQQSAAYYYAVNRNKRSLALDLKSNTDREHLLKLISQADVVVENFKVGMLKKLNLDYGSLKNQFPRLIFCSISGFGQTGPYAHKPGYDALVQAMGGLMSVTGPDKNTPTKVGVAATDIMTGLYAAIAILAAVNERRTSGLGQHIDLSLFDTQVSWLINIAMNYLVSQKIPEPLGTGHPNIVPYQAFHCADKPLYLAVGNDSQFAKLSLCMGQSWHENPEYATNRARVENRAKLVASISAEFGKKSRGEWIALFDEKGIPVGPINDMSDLAKDPQVIAKKLFTQMSDSNIPCLKSPIHFSRTPIGEYKTPAHKASLEKFDFGVFDETT